MKHKQELKGFLFAKISNHCNTIDADDILNWLVDFEQKFEENEK